MTEAGIAAVLAQFAVLIGSLTAFGYLLLRAYIVIRQLGHEQKRRDDQTDDSVSIVASALLRRGRAEAIQKRILIELPESEEAMMKIREDVVEAYSPVLPVFRQLRTANPLISREQFALLLEKTYGAWFVKHICAVYGVSNFACLDMAVSLTFGEAITC